MIQPRSLFLAVFTASVLSACAASPPVEGDKVSLQGRLVLKGSAPMVRPTLQVNGTSSWDLTGMDLATAIQLQNRIVVVTGVVMPANQEPTLLRSIQVTGVKPAQ